MFFPNKSIGEIITSWPQKFLLLRAYFKHCQGKTHFQTAFESHDLNMNFRSFTAMGICIYGRI